MISPETFARYAAMRVPRYTSYPTAPQFSPDIGSGEYRRWLQAVPSNEPLSVYLHIPFCREMCWYCGCHTTVTRRREPIERYVAALSSEIREVSGELREEVQIGHLHWGGGSPTLLPESAIEQLSRQLRDRFSFRPDAEIAVEVDPRTLTRSVAGAFAAAGINRASLGVQSFDPVVQKAINRVQSFDVTRSAVDLLRTSGVRGLNFDLVYGLPFQSVSSCLSSVERALELRPDRLSIFGYAHVPSFKPHQRKIDERALPAEQERHEQFRQMAQLLVQHGYLQLGLDHFALPADPLARAAAEGRLRRNFQGYTVDSCPTLIGLGASAIGQLSDGFVQNSARIPDYEARIAVDGLATTRGCAFTGEDRRRGAVIEQLMCNYEAEIGNLTAPLAALEADGLISRDGTRIKVAEQARPLVRTVAAAFDAYLARSGATHAPAV